MQLIHQCANQKGPGSHFEEEQSKTFPASPLCSESMSPRALLSPRLQHPHVASSTHASPPAPTHRALLVKAQESPASSRGPAGQFHFLLLPAGSHLLASIPTQIIHRTGLDPYVLAFLMLSFALWLHRSMFFF